MSEVLVATGGHQQRTPGENLPDTATTRRVVRIEHFEAPFALGDEEGAAYRRRFATLFADDARSRRGGLGRVTHVTNALGEQYALKTLIVPGEQSDGEKDLGSDRSRREEVLRAAFRREYESQRALANLRGFPRIYGFGEADGLPAIIMEWVEGITLADAQRALAVDDAGRLSPLTVARIGAELFELVSRLSLVGEGLVHRDLSPANIMIRTSRHTLAEQRASGSFELCLIDFGSSAEVGTEGGSFTRSHATVRHATADYAPPEMLSNDIAAVAELRRSSAIDVYAAASVLCELLDGRPPFAEVEDDADAGIVSPYRLKTEHAPARPCSAHRATGSLRDTISLEGETALVVGPLALERELSPDSDELRRALALVDDQLADILLSCLSVDQRRRPPAAAVRDELILFCERYGENVRRALAGENHALHDGDALAGNRAHVLCPARRAAAWSRYPRARLGCRGSCHGVAGGVGAYCDNGNRAPLPDGAGNRGPCRPREVLGCAGTEARQHCASCRYGGCGVRHAAAPRTGSALARSSRRVFCHGVCELVLARHRLRLRLRARPCARDASPAARRRVWPGGTNPIAHGHNKGAACLEGVGRRREGSPLATGRGAVAVGRVKRVASE